MKKVEAVIKPYLLEVVKDALEELGHIGMTISEIKDFSFEGAGAAASSTMPHRFLPRLKIEVVVANEYLASAVQTIRRAGLNLGAAESLTVHEVEDVIRIRTAEHGESAI